jgi:nucleoside-diphosphate-sugar epimerase
MSPLAVTSRPNLIVGCGYLGRRVARRWLVSGQPVVALTRRNADPLRALGIDPIVGDVLDPPSLRQLPDAATVLYAVGLDRSASRSMREVYVSGLCNVLDTLPRFDRSIYISSTSVYGQTDGELVDENAPTSPIEDSGRIVLEAERLLRAKRPDAIILRFGGIYGPDRLLRRQAQLRTGEPLTGDADRWLNLIHVDDGADAVLAAEARGAPGETYNIVDDEPASRGAFYALLAELVGAPPPRFDGRPEPTASHRRVSNAKAKAALGWKPRYPSFRAGLPAALRETTMQ